MVPKHRIGETANRICPLDKLRDALSLETDLTQAELIYASERAVLAHVTKNTKGFSTAG